jgi:hypothetical protein
MFGRKGFRHWGPRGNVAASRLSAGWRHCKRVLDKRWSTHWKHSYLAGQFSHCKWRCFRNAVSLMEPHVL